jgi:NAD(P)-dependent dehydrogenase (short-subunit alcohol dehydrogenase family)
MIDHGAKTIMLLSRSGADKETLQRLRQELQDYDADVVAVNCDATDEAQVRQLIKDCQRAFPPICGVIHAAMVLRVSIGISPPLQSEQS